ncbi:MAG: hypothetical protein WDN28_10915 [Chthoniobacter sp.]
MCQAVVRVALHLAGGRGFERDGQRRSTRDALQSLLEPHFDLIKSSDQPFLIREHARKYQWSVAETTTWLRRQAAPQTLSS